jgi:hypothetical protein
MGQDTYATILVTCKLERKYENADLIKKFIKNKFKYYLMGEYIKLECSDNYLDIDNLDEKEENMYKNDKFIYSKEYDEKEYDEKNKLYYIFYIEIYECYARNISRREKPSIIGENEIEEIDELINKIEKARKQFKKVEPKCELKIKYSFHDSY